LVAPIERGATVLAREVRTAPGGKGLNQAVAASRAGAATAIVGVVGDDPSGVRLRSVAVEAGIDVSGLDVRQGSTSGCAYVLVGPDGSSTIAVDPGANALLSAASAGRFAQAAVVVAQLEISLDAVRAAFTRARELGSRTVLSASPLVPDCASLLGMTDVVICNEDEAAQLAASLPDGDRAPGKGSESDPARRFGDEVPGVVKAAADAGRALVALGAGACVVTLGGDGAVVIEGGVTTHVPPVRVENVQDTTGAGDAATGALAASLARGASLVEATGAAMVAGAAVVASLGAFG